MLKKSSNLRKKPTQLKKEKRTLFQAVATGENVVSTAFPFGNLKEILSYSMYILGCVLIISLLSSMQLFKQ